MPIYEYRCQSCGHEFETIQKVSDAALTTCPACAQESLRKKVSAAGFRLKGGGWYETDFKKAGNKKNVAAEGGGEPGGGKDAGGKESAGGDGGAKSTDKQASGDGGATAKKSADGAGATATKSGD